MLRFDLENHGFDVEPETYIWRTGGYKIRLNYNTEAERWEAVTSPGDHKTHFTHRHPSLIKELLDFWVVDLIMGQFKERCRKKIKFWQTVLSKADKVNFHHADTVAEFDDYLSPLVNYKGIICHTQIEDPCVLSIYEELHETTG